MKQTILTLAAAILATGGMMKAENPSDSAAVQKRYNQIERAIEAKDLNRFLAFYDANCQVVESGEKLSLERYGDNWRLHLALARNLKPKFTITGVETANNKVVVSYQEEMRFEFQDTDSSEWTPFTYSAAREDTWQMKGGRWTIVESKAQHQQMALNLPH